MHEVIALFMIKHRFEAILGPRGFRLRVILGPPADRHAVARKEVLLRLERQLPHVLVRRHWDRVDAVGTRGPLELAAVALSNLQGCTRKEVDGLYRVTIRVLYGQFSKIRSLAGSLLYGCRAILGTPKGTLV